MANDTGAANSQERSAAEFLIFETRFEFLQAADQALTGLGGDHRQEFGHFLLERAEEKFDRSLARLKQDVAGEAFADDHAGAAVVDISAFDVTDEAILHLTVEKQGAGRADEVGSFVFFGADVQNADAGLGDAQDSLGVDRTHDAVLIKVLGFRVHIRADVDDGDRPEMRGIDRGDTGATDAGKKHFGVEKSGGDHRAGVACGDDGLDFPFGHEPPADGDRIIAFFAKGLDRFFLHADDFARMDDRQTIARGVGDFGKLGLDAIAIADEVDDQLRLRERGLRRSGDDRAGRVIAAHGVQGNPHTSLSSESEIVPTRI